MRENAPNNSYNALMIKVILYETNYLIFMDKIDIPKSSIQINGNLQLVVNYKHILHLVF